MSTTKSGRYPYNNEFWTGQYRYARDQGKGHEAAINVADEWLQRARRDRGDYRRPRTGPDGIYQTRPDYGLLKPGYGQTGYPLDTDTDTDTSPGRGPVAGAIRQQTGGPGVVARLRRRRMGLAGTGVGAQAVNRGAAAGGMTGPGAQARAMRRSERRMGMGAGGIAARSPGLARVREIGAALRARRAGLADRPDVEELADELAEAIDTGDIGAADIPEAAADAGAAGAELLAALAAAAADDPSDDLADVLAAIAEAAAAATSTACTCTTSDIEAPMMPSAAVLASIAAQLQASGLASPQSGRFGRVALAERETGFRLARIAGLAAGGVSNQVVNTNKDLAPGSAIYAVAIDPATGNQVFDVALSNVTISGDNVYQGPAGVTDFPSLQSNGLSAPGLLITRKIPSGTQITFSVQNNHTAAINALIELRAQATNAVGNIDGSCSA